MKRSALNKAAELLSRSEQSVESIRRKLLARKYDELEVEEAIEKLKRYKYLNDEENCRRKFENYYDECKLSIRQIKWKLLRQGYEEDLIESLIPEDAEEHELIVARRILDKSGCDDELKARKILASRGFDFDVISLACGD